MSFDRSLLTADERNVFEHSILARHRLEEQYRNPEQQRQAATTAMWVFLATEVMFFGALFLGLAVYHYQYPTSFETASKQLVWQIGGLNTIVLLVSSFTIVLAVHFARLGRRKALMICLLVTAALGVAFLGLKGFEYYLDYRDNLIPGWRFNPQEWIDHHGLSADQVPHVELFLLFYWTMTLIHALHMVIGITAVLVIFALAARRHFSAEYNTPVDVLALYWHFVDIVWIFLLPMLYLLGSHASH